MLPRSLKTGTKCQPEGPEGTARLGLFIMNLSQPAKACVLSLAIVPLVGTSLDFDFGSSRWIMLAAAAVILLPIAAMLARQMVRAKRVYPVFPAEVTTERISNHLVVLSSAAVLAIYSAGYLKTRPAAERIAARSGYRVLRVASAAGANQ